MLFALARELGMIVSELSSRMSARELIEWSVYLSIKDEDLKNCTVEDQVKNLFGAISG